MASGYSFEDVWFEPGGVAVLRGVDVDLGGDGGITAIVGPSGSGKSSMLRLCNRLEVPSRGIVRLGGVDLSTMDPLALRRRAGMVFQQAARFPGTIADNLRVARPEADDDALAGAVRQVHLDPDLLDREAATLSVGEAQRMALARTLLASPEILLMDEPTSALDVDATKALERLARDLAADGLPVLWVTHDLDQAARLGKRIVVVDGGRIADEETTTRSLHERTFVQLPPDPEDTDAHH